MSCNKNFSVEITRGFAAGGHLRIASMGQEKMDVHGIGQHVSHAAENGHLEVLQWARKNGCEWNSGVCMRMLLKMDI